LSSLVWDAGQGPGSTSPLLAVVVGTLATAGGVLALICRRWLWAQMGMEHPPEPFEPGRAMYLLSAIAAPISFIAVGMTFVCEGLMRL
jgi:hypothetical protein